MNDDTKKPPRGRGRPGGPGGRGPGERDRAPRKGGPGKPGREGEKPFRKRADAGAPGEGRTERPWRERPEGAGKPFRKPREAGQGERFGGPRRERGGDERPARPQRPFRNEEGAPGEGRTERPWRERPEGAGKPFRKPREAGQGERFGSPRPERGSDARPPREGKPFRAGKPFEKRPRETAAESGAPEQGERIAKRLARAGISSRRNAEELIAAGRVKVNGKVLASPAFNVHPEDRIELDGKEIPPVERTRLFLFHKPAGVVTTSRDPEGRTTVFDVLPKDLPRLMTIGRLDINTEGLLLLTNDGGLARVLELPATGWLRRYRVRVHGKVDETALAELKNGIAIDGVFYGSVEAALERVQGTNAWLTVGLREGKNREVKNIMGALGLEVTRLIRVSYGPFQLGELSEGAVQEIKGRMLRDQLGERLIEEAGANFDAPIVTPFSNRPVRRDEQEDRPDEDQPPRRPRERPAGAEPGYRKRGGGRAETLDRLQTRPRHFAKPGEKEEARERPAGRRSANVWMAPGARPAGAKGTPKGAGRPKGEGKGGRPAGSSRGEFRAKDRPGGGDRDARGPGGGKPFPGKGPGKGPRKPPKKG